MPNERCVHWWLFQITLKEPNERYPHSTIQKPWTTFHNCDGIQGHYLLFSKEKAHSPTIARVPTRRINSWQPRCRHVESTADSPEWDPHGQLFDQNENAMPKYYLRRGTIMKAKTDLSSQTQMPKKHLSLCLPSLEPCRIFRTLSIAVLFVSAICSTVKDMYDDFVESKTNTQEPERTRIIASTKCKPR